MVSTLCSYRIFFFWYVYVIVFGLPRWLSGKESVCQCRRPRFDPWVRKIYWSRKWQPILVFLSGKLQGQRKLAVCSPWDCKELEMTEQLGKHTCT